MSTHKYEELADKLRSDILSGVVREGDKLPSENVLVSDTGYCRQTVRQALSILEKEGRIRRKRGSGTTVTSRNRKAPPGQGIAVITTYIGEYIFPDILRGIETELARGGFAPMISATYNRVDKERELLLGLIEHPVAGLIVEGTKTALPNPNIALYRQLEELGVPIVFFNGYYPEYMPAAYVVADDRQGGRMAARHLAEKGYKRIGGIFKSDDIQGHRRYAGYLDGLSESNMSVVDSHILWYTTESRKLLTESAMLEQIYPPECDALVCYNDEAAIQLLTALREKEIRIPEDLAIISFDDSTFSRMSSPPLTSLHLNKEGLGALAAKKLLALMRGEAPKPEILSWELVLRGSS